MSKGGRSEVDLADAPSLPQRVATLVHEGPVQPGGDQRFLRRFVGVGLVAQDRASGAEELACPWLDQAGEGVS
jgi:hypothetical protein